MTAFAAKKQRDREEVFIAVRRFRGGGEIATPPCPGARRFLRGNNGATTTRGSLF
jgi:hypothetical protein